MYLKEIVIKAAVFAPVQGTEWAVCNHCSKVSKLQSPL